MAEAASSLVEPVSSQAPRRYRKGLSGHARAHERLEQQQDVDFRSATANDREDVSAPICKTMCDDCWWLDIWHPRKMPVRLKPRGKPAVCNPHELIRILRKRLHKESRKRKSPGDYPGLSP